MQVSSGSRCLVVYQQLRWLLPDKPRRERAGELQLASYLRRGSHGGAGFHSACVPGAGGQRGPFKMPASTGIKEGGLTGPVGYALQ
jgi:hypothetical protein